MKSGSICKQTVFKTGNVKSGNVKKKLGNGRKEEARKRSLGLLVPKKAKRK